MCRKVADEKGLTLPILLDGDGHTADVFGTETTTTTVVIDASGVLRYCGRFARDKEQCAEAREQTMLTIRRATESDSDAIWRVFREVVREGNAFLSDETISRRDALHLFCSDGVISYVATVGEKVVGAYNVKRNHPGRGSHVANATYMVAAEYRGRGIGRKLAEHSLQVAKEQGYRAMQFNAVVSTNSAAVALWQRLGFETVGIIPQGFADPNHGLVDVFIMHKQL